ncbi:MAG: alpha/beta hydrolase, partial [Pseudorhodobacter sp.]|nr:alpha/beta hydrolase [Frankiaceae bacterium]
MSTVDVNGTPICYVEVGPSGGTPVLLSHSLFFDHTMFDELAGLLAEQGYRVVSYDQRGQGANLAATRDEVSMDALTDDPATRIGALGLGRVHVVGNSLGGFVALRLAARHPGPLISAAAIGSSAEEEHSLAAFAPL